MDKYLKKYFPVFTFPTLIAFTIAFLVPFILGIYLSFTEFTTLSNAKWVGVDNYINAFAEDSNFFSALVFTTKFTVVSVILINIFAFAFASMLTRGIPGSDALKTIFFMPNLIGGIVLGYIWQLIINGFLINNFGVDITFDSKYGFWGLVIMMNWQMIGYMMVIYIASLQAIPEEITEAAKIDGATPFQMLRHITIPMVMPAITICTFLTLTNSFRLFDQNLALTNGAPAEKSTMLALDIYKTFYRRPGYEGVGQAKAVIFFILVGVIAYIQLFLTRNREVEQ